MIDILNEKIIPFLREHWKIVLGVFLVVVLVAVLAACSTIGEAEQVQFGLVNTTSGSSNHVIDSV